MRRECFIISLFKFITPCNISQSRMFLTLPTLWRRDGLPSELDVMWHERDKEKPVCRVEVGAWIKARCGPSICVETSNTPRSLPLSWSCDSSTSAAAVVVWWELCIPDRPAPARLGDATATTCRHHRTPTHATQYEVVKVLTAQPHHSSTTHLLGLVRNHKYILN